MAPHLHCQRLGPEDSPCARGAGCAPGPLLLGGSVATAARLGAVYPHSYAQGSCQTCPSGCFPNAAAPDELGALPPAALHRRSPAKLYKDFDAPTPLPFSTLRYRDVLYGSGQGKSELARTRAGEARYQAPRLAAILPMLIHPSRMLILPHADPSS